MATLTQQLENADDATQRKVWLALNRGVLSRIARELGYSTVFVADVFHGRRKSSLVKSALAAVHAPGFEVYATQPDRESL